MRERLFVGWWMGVCLLAAGCGREKASTEPGEQPGRSAPKIAVLPDVTLNSLQAALGADYALQPRKEASNVKVIGADPGTPVSLLRTADTHKIQVTAIEDASGGIRGMSAHVIGPRESADKPCDLMREVAGTLAAAAGVVDESTFADHLEIALIRARLGFATNLRLESFMFTWTTAQKLREDDPTVAYEPDRVERQFRISPAVGSPGPEPKPIPGATLAQLESLLDGFSLKAKVEGKQRLYLRELDTHEELVQCTLDANGGITGIEAFVGDVAEGSDAAKLNEQLWIKLAQLQYTDSNPEKIIAFLIGPKLEYAVGVGEEVANVSFFLPVGGDGQRRQLTVWTIP